MRVRDKTVVITGAASGIGFATAVELAARGARIAAFDLDRPGLEHLRARLEGSLVCGIEVDLTSWDGLETGFREVERRFGSIQAIHLNAGINTGKPRFPGAPRDRWERTLAVDLWAVLAGVQLGVGALRRAGGGVLAMTASLAALTPFPADPVYAAAKAGVVSLARSLTFLESEGIRVLCVCPGMVDTPLLHKRDLTRKEEAIVRSVPLLSPDEVGRHVAELIEQDTASGEVFGLLPGRPPKLIGPQMTFAEDPTADLES